jgi:hypothetical protein
MGIVGTHPAVFVRVASKGVTGYGTWKSAERIENKRLAKRPFAGKWGEIIMEFKSVVSQRFASCLP